MKFILTFGLHNGRVPEAFLGFSLLPGMGRARYVSLVLMLWLSGVVIDWTFPQEVWMFAHTYSLIIAVFIHVLNFRGWSQP